MSAHRRQSHLIMGLLISLLHIHSSDPLIHRSERIIRLQMGNLQGFVVKPNHRALGMVEVFLGVPYAAPPVGNLRFMPPMQSFPWSYIRRAETMPHVCPQKLPNVSNRRQALKRMPEGRYNYLQRLIPMLRNQSEDCLYLNIYVPVSAPGTQPERMAVLVYIHGESYEWNSGNPYDGITLASYGQVVVVTVNFRLGVLGFLRPSLSEKRVSNFGLLDQIAALLWIKENITPFGGDSGRVTIFGHGTGAALANLLLLSPVSQVSDGLFQRAILMSGSALSKWALTWDPYQYTIQVAKKVGCPLNEFGEELERCLRSKTVDELLSVKIQTPPFTTSLGPIVDNIIIADPTIAMSVGSTIFGRYELLYGVTQAECYNMLTAAEVKLGMTSARRDKLLRAYVSNNFNHHASQVYSAIGNEYTSYSPNKFADERNIRDKTLEILSDAQIVAPVVNTGNLHSDLNSKSYFYVFNHQSTYGDYPTQEGTVHGEELPYVFGAPLVGGFSHFALNYTLEEVFLSELVMILWTNFAKTGNPNLPPPQDFLTPGSTPDWEDNMRTLWPPYDKLTQHYLNLNMQVVKNSYYRARKLAFWNRLIPDLISSSGIIRDPVAAESFPGATYPTITLVPSVKPDFSSLFVPDKPATQRPNYFPEGPKPIKPVEQYRRKTHPHPVYPLPDKTANTFEKKKSEEIKAEEAIIAGAPMGTIITIGAIILSVNCIALALLFYYHKRKLKLQTSGGDEEEPSKGEVSEADSDGFSSLIEDKNSERKSRRKRRTSEKDCQDTNSESASRVSSVSRESSTRRKHSQSQDSSASIEVAVSKITTATVNSNEKGHKRSKSAHSFYNEIGKDDPKPLNKKDGRQSKTPSVKFNTMTTMSGNNLNRSTTSIASKSSVRSTSSRTSGRSITSKASVKSGASFKAVKKNASCQSLPTSDYNGWTISKDESNNSSHSRSKEDSTSEKQHNLVIMQKLNYPKVLPDSSEIENSSTLPRTRPPPPPRSTSLTARDIQELEKLQEVYRNSRPPRHTSSDSCEMSGSEPFYSMGGGEAPARAPGLMYGPTLSNTNTARRGSHKEDGPEYEQYQKYQPPYQLRESPVVGETQLSTAKPYLTYGDNRAPRGPLAAFGKVKNLQPNQLDYELARGSSVSPISPMPPPIPAHQVPLTPSIMKNPPPPSYPPPQNTEESEPLPSSVAMFEQTENTGTIKRQKAKSAPTTPGIDTTEKPLKSALRSISAYDKPKGNNASNNSVGTPTASISATGNVAALSVSSTSSTSPSISSSGSGLPSPTELKSILVKRPRTTTVTSSKTTSDDSTLPNDN